MAGPDRTENNTVRDRLLEEGHAFSFFQAVNLLERALLECPEVGALGPVDDERIRFAGTRSLSFAPSDISDIEIVHLKGRTGEDRGAVDSWRDLPPPAEKAGTEADTAPVSDDELAAAMYRIHVTFMGLYGPPSPLPPAFTEAIVRFDKPNEELAEFLDVFNHRFISLLYRIWKKYRYYIQFDGSGKDPFSAIVFAVLGMERDAAENRFGLRWVRLMPFAGLMGMYCHSAPMLAGVISHYFDSTPVEIEEFCERIVTIAMEQRARLGNPTAQLGRTMTLGDHVHDVAGKFRIWLGPVDFDTYARFLPNGDWFHEMRNLVRVSLRDPLDFDIGVIVEPEQVPRCTLGKTSRSQLGWSSWLGSERKERVKVVRDMHLHKAAH